LSFVIKDINSALKDKDYSYEILVVDDSSSDKSASVAEGLGCRVIRRSFKGGAGAARKTGIIAALGNIIVMLDADGSYSVSDIPKMLKYITEYYPYAGIISCRPQNTGFKYRLKSI
jgi:glycosyltransferase involved in cell wall biosynthesis